MNVADLLAAQEENRKALGGLFADAGAKATEPTDAQRREVEEALRLEREQALAAEVGKRLAALQTTEA